MRSVSGRVLVTGANGGLGAAIARQFAAHGSELVLSGRRADALEPLARQLGADVVIADLARREQLLEMVRAAGELDVVVANGALPGTGRLLELTPGQIDTVLEVNLAAQIALARAVLPGMLERGRGHIVLVGSLSGRVASAESSLYSATKFGLRGFGLALRQDLHGSGVSASVVSPGFVSDAGMFHDAGVELPPGASTVTPEAVARAVLSAVRRDRAEVSVAPLGLKLGAALGGLLPGLSAVVQRRAGGSELARRLSEAQIAKRPVG